MRIREAIVRNENELPGYKLIGYEEVAIPIFQRKLHVLALMQKSIPVVEEFVLNFYKEDLNLDQIRLLLGLDQQLIDEAWAGLIQRDYINHMNKTITDSGYNYLENNKVENLEKIEFSISIDGLTGQISKLNNNLMITKNIKNKGIKSLKSNINRPDIQDLDFKDVKRVFSKYKDIDKESYSGNILDIVHMEGNTTKFRRVDILMFKNNEDDIRILAYDGFNRLDDYEEKLLELDNKGINLLRYNFENYFQNEKIEMIQDVIKNGCENDCNVIEYEKVNDLWGKYLDERKEEIIIVAPLVSKCKLTEAFIDKLERKAKEGIKIKFIIAGNDYVDEYQKKIYKKLSKVCNKSNNLNLIQVPCYLNKMIINNSKREAIISIYEENNTGLNGSKIGIVEKFYEVKNDTFQRIKDLVINIYDIDDIKKFDLSNCNKIFLKNKMECISRMVKDADGYMLSNDGIGWIGEDEIPDISNFLEVPLAKNGEKFRTFIDCVNKSLIEALDINAKINNKRKYFWDDFKNKYTYLQSTLDKIRTYRNRSNHLELTENNKKKYFKYLQKDLNGYMPDFIQNGYLILQFKIINELEEAIKKTINKINY